ncbi:hypothetical protein R50073_12290 [Maricurvus nonylphenolicus]|uniref:flavin reductase family protein n=1 Tax=Maricurvus nonylphenolicus TaxID=1008307 RepID=UPI0036F2A82F
MASIDITEFRNALGSFPTGVTVITTTDREGNPIAMTASSFNSVSLDPPLILWSIGYERSSLPAFRETGKFVVHVLAEDQIDISNKFAGSGAGDFSEVEYDKNDHGIPMLPGCVSRFECVTRHEYEGGDHLIIVGEVERFVTEDKQPLLFCRGKYAEIKKG